MLAAACPSKANNIEYDNYLQRLVSHHAQILTDSSYSNTELQCLAKNIYFEARGEPIRGQLAVANVTVNRVNVTNHTLCGVVYARGQFQWTSRPQRNPIGPLWNQARALAWIVINQPELVVDVTDSSHHFHSGSKPTSFRGLQYVTTIGGHKFYRNNKYEEIARAQ
jgi:N-acetylmuramoyl-L-alanine amidase